MKYAMVRSGNKQYTVYENKIVEVERLHNKKDDAFSFENVLLLVSDGKTHVGTPLVANAIVSGKVLGEVKGDKIRVSKFKSKVRFRRVTGFRAKKTQIMVEKIELSAKSATKETKPEAEKPIRQAQGKSVKKARKAV